MNRLLAAVQRDRDLTARWIVGVAIGLGTVIRIPQLFHSLAEAYAFRQAQTAVIAQQYAEDGINLLAGYKRAANILKKEDWNPAAERPNQGIARTGEEDPLANVDDPDLALVIAAQLAERRERKSELSYSPEPAEQALIDALAAAEPAADAAITAEDFTAAMAALASLRAPIDAFFEAVTVNDEDQSKRHARLNLLAQFRGAVHKVADFGQIQG